MAVQHRLHMAVQHSLDMAAQHQGARHTRITSPDCAHTGQRPGSVLLEKGADPDTDRILADQIHFFADVDLLTGKLNCGRSGRMAKSLTTLGCRRGRSSNRQVYRALPL